MRLLTSYRTLHVFIVQCLLYVSIKVTYVAVKFLQFILLPSFALCVRQNSNFQDLHCSEAADWLFPMHIPSHNIDNIYTSTYDSDVQKSSQWSLTHKATLIGSRPSYHYFRSVCLFVCLSVWLFVCAEFFSAVFDPIWIKLGHMLHVRV